MRFIGSRKRRIMGIIVLIFLVVSLLFLYLVVLTPVYVVRTNSSYNADVLGPYAFESSQTSLSQSFVDLYGFPAFNNITSEGFSSWYLKIYVNLEDRYQWNQRIDLQIYASAKYGNDPNGIWSTLPTDLIKLDMSSIHLLQSRENIDYSFSTTLPKTVGKLANETSFEFLGGLSVQEAKKFDRAEIQEKFELTLLLNNAVTTNWYYGNCELQECIQQLRIRIGLQFFERVIFGNWKLVEEILYTLGDGDTPLDMTSLQLIPRST